MNCTIASAYYGPLEAARESIFLLFGRFLDREKFRFRIRVEGLNILLFPRNDAQPGLPSWVTATFLRLWLSLGMRLSSERTN
jgi:hypothetical protein